MYHKKILFTFFILLSLSTFSQVKNSKTELTGEWSLLMESNDISFYVRKSECTIEGSPKPLVYTFLKVVNNSSSIKKIYFNFGLQYVEGCSGCDDNSEYSVHIELPANETVIGDCNFENTRLTRLIYNPNLSGGWKFEAPILTNLSIE